MIGDPWDVTLDPNDQDTDNDLLGDYEEFQHSSDPNNTDTDGDSIGDYAESNSLKNSITGFDGIAPSLTIDIKTVKKGFGRYHMRITIWSSDMAGIDKVRICVRGIKSKTWQMYGESSGEKTLSFKKDWGRDLGDGYKILAQTWDVNGNFGEAKKEVPGITKRIVDFVMEIVEKIKEAVEAFIEALLDWVWKAIRWAIDCVLSPIKDAMENWVGTLAKKISEFVTYTGESIDIVGELSKMVSTILTFIMIPLNIINAIVWVVDGFGWALEFSGAGSIVTFLAPIILSLISMAVVSAAIDILSPTQDAALDLMGKAGASFSLSALFIKAYGDYLHGQQKKSFKGLAFTVLGLIFAILSILALNRGAPGFMIFIIDLVSAGLILIGAYKSFKETSCNILKLLSKAVAIAAVISIPLTFIARAADGTYSR